MKIDSWDSEDAKLYANELLVWQETFSGSSGDQLCGRTNNNWHEDKIIRQIDVGFVTDSSITFEWSTTLSSGATDESWGLQDVDIYSYVDTDAVAYESDFKNDGDEDWLFTGSDGGTTVCDGITLLGGYATLDKYDIAKYMVELDFHTSIQV